MATAFYELLNSLEAQTKILGAPLDVGPLALRERLGGTEHDPLGTARGVGPTSSGAPNIFVCASSESSSS